jgi:two-component system, OmpR family, response regulator MprA
MDAMRVLVIEDDESVRQALRRALVLAGWEVSLAEDGRSGLDALDAEPADVIVLDVSLPDVDGLDVARTLRSAGNRTPILMLTARAEIPDRIAGLDSGADDYVLKPYDVGELQARLRALTRREPGGPESRHRFAELQLDQGMQAVVVGATTTTLTRIEIRLMELLMSTPRQIVDYETIYRRLWNQSFDPGANALRVTVVNLRRKLETAGARRLIHTVHGVGYVLREP